MQNLSHSEIFSHYGIDGTALWEWEGAHISTLQGVLYLFQHGLNHMHGIPVGETLRLQIIYDKKIIGHTPPCVLFASDRLPSPALIHGAAAVKFLQTIGEETEAPWSRQ